MSAAEILFKNVIQSIAKNLKVQGFTRQKNTFYLRRDDDWGVINVQKSLQSHAAEITFTINLGICLKSVTEFLDPTLAHQKPIVSDCQWKKRIGEWMGTDDYWWKINSETNITLLEQEIQNILINVALPDMRQCLQEDALLTLWLNGVHTGITPMQRMMNAAILLKKRGRHIEMENMIQQLEAETAGKPSAAMANFVKEKLR